MEAARDRLVSIPREASKVHPASFYYYYQTFPPSNESDSAVAACDLPCDSSLLRAGSRPLA